MNLSKLQWRKCHWRFVVCSFFKRENRNVFVALSCRKLMWFTVWIHDQGLIFDLCHFTRLCSLCSFQKQKEIDFHKREEKRLKWRHSRIFLNRCSLSARSRMMLLADGCVLITDAGRLLDCWNTTPGDKVTWASVCSLAVRSLTWIVIINTFSHKKSGRHSSLCSSCSRVHQSTLNKSFPVL